MSSPAPVLTFSGLTLAYGEKPLWEGLTGALPPGQLWAVLGRNGAGKTSFLEVLAGLRTPNAGEVCIPFSPTHGAGGLGVMLQTLALPDDMEVGEALQLFAQLQGAPASAWAQAQAAWATLWRRRFRLLTPGQRQRLGWSLARLNAPRLLLLDEPTAGLDPEAKAVFFSELAAFRAAGGGALWATHELAEARAWSDRALVLRDGGWEWWERPERVAAARRLRVRWQGQLTPPEWRDVPGVRSAQAEAGGWGLEVDDPGKALAALAVRAEAQGWQWEECALLEPEWLAPRKEAP